MSLFDPPKQEKLSDVFPINTLFWLLSANYEGIQPTSFGDGPQASVTVCPVSKQDEQRQFRVWGSLAEQISQMEDGELPAEVEITKMGRKNVWRFSKKLEGVSVSENVAEEDTPF